MSTAARASPRLGSQLDGLSTCLALDASDDMAFRAQRLSPAAAGRQRCRSSQQQLVAIYQLLKVCGEYAAMGETNRKHFLGSRPAHRSAQ